MKQKKEKKKKNRQQQSPSRSKSQKKAKKVKKEKKEKKDKKKNKDKSKHKHSQSKQDQQNDGLDDSPKRKEKSIKKRSSQKQKSSFYNASPNYECNEQQNDAQVKQQPINKGWSSSERQSQLFQPKKQQKNQAQQKPKKQEPNFQPSGILLQYYNSRQGVSLKFHQPPSAHKPTNQWRVYPFKDNQPLNPIILTQSCYLIGKDERVCDILCQNSSISRQHAVIQFKSEYIHQMGGGYKQLVRPYIMDLQSTNGTHLNGKRIQATRYIQLLHKDVLKFGLSDREYVMIKVPEDPNLQDQEEQQQF